MGVRLWISFLNLIGLLSRKLLIIRKNSARKISKQMYIFPLMATHTHARLANNWPNGLQYVHSYHLCVIVSASHTLITPFFYHILSCITFQCVKMLPHLCLNSSRFNYKWVWTSIPLYFWTLSYWFLRVLYALRKWTPNLETLSLA